jgi:hypothetical protein
LLLAVAFLGMCLVPSARAQEVELTFTVTPSVVQGGQSAQGIMTLKATGLPIPLPDPITLDLKSSSPAAKVPATAQLSKGLATFTITTTPVTADTTATISASIQGGEPVTATLRITVGPPPNTAPVFTSTSGCDQTVMFRLLLGQPLQVSASDTQGQTMTLAVSGAPSWLQISTANGNPATATIRSDLLGSPDLVGALGAALSGSSASVVVRATDDGVPSQTQSCVIGARLSIF